MWVETFTGLWATQFAGLVKGVPERGGNGNGAGRAPGRVGRGVWRRLSGRWWVRCTIAPT